MGKKSRAKSFRKLAADANFPVMQDLAIERHNYSGQDLETKYPNYVPKNDDGTPKKLDPKATFTINVPCHVPVNHGRRLRRAFQRNGIEGVNAIAQKVAEYVAKNSRPAVSPAEAEIESAEITAEVSHEPVKD